MSSAVRIDLGADEADFEDTARGVCSGNMSTIAPRACASLEPLCISSVRSAMRSRRQATLTVSRRSSTHFTGAELEDDFVDVGFKEEAADAVEEERPR